MKLRFSLNASTRHRELVVHSQKNEVLNPQQATWVSGGPHAVFLPANCRLLGKSERSVVTYDVDGLVSVGRFVRRHVIDGSEYVLMLADLACAYGCCTFGPGKQYWQRSLLFDDKHVFVNASSRLRFAFVPLDGIPFSLNSSPLTLLRLLSDVRKLKFATPNDVALAQCLANFVLNERDAFSFNSYRGFLRRECGIEIDPSGSVANHVGETQDDVVCDGSWIPTTRSRAQFASAAGPSVGDLVGRAAPAHCGQQGGRMQPEGFGQSEACRRRASSAQRAASLQGVAGQAPPPVPWQGPQYALVRVSTGDTYYFIPGMRLEVGRGTGGDADSGGDPPGFRVLVARGSSGDPSRRRVPIFGIPKMSRRHAQIVVADDAITLTDLGSTNGTYVDGRRLEPRVPVRISFGQSFCLYQEEFAVVARLNRV